MKAIVLAAGRGERMRPLTDTLPKPLLPIGGRALIVWHLEALARAGIHDVVVNLSWLGDRLREALDDGAAHGVRITWSDEGPIALETGGGIFRALPHLGPGPFLVVNGDIWTDIDFATIGIGDAALARLVLVPNPPHHPLGDFTLHDGLVREAEGPRHTYSGVGVYRPEFFEGCAAGRFRLLPLLRRAIAAGRLEGRLHSGEWQDIGTPERLAALDAAMTKPGDPAGAIA
jgi:MurNAc alpha-1-phosphate uridylyltransferase